jgi:hypothetical protein
MTMRTAMLALVALATLIPNVGCVGARGACSQCQGCDGHGGGCIRNGFFAQTFGPDRFATGAQEGMGAPQTGQVAYPYYTNRGPRDFLMSNPPSIGH